MSTVRRVLIVGVGLLVVAFGKLLGPEIARSLIGAQHTVESVAVEIARQHNENAAKMIDEMTLSTSARADGKNVILTYVLRVRKGLSPTDRADFKAGLDKEVVGPACKVNDNNDAFKLGLFYTFVYRNAHDEVLAEFVVSKRTCDARR